MLQKSDSLPLEFLKTVYVVDADRFMIYNTDTEVPGSISGATRFSE